jgi:hypothetical protein
MKKLKKIKKKSKLKTIDKSKFYSATSLVNFIRSDCIVDLIETLNKNNYMIDFEDELRIKKRNLQESSNSNLSNNCSDLITKRRRTSSFDYIVDDGYKFEANIIIKIKEKLIDNNELSKLIELSDVDINIRYERTLKVLLSKSYDIILGSILINESNKTYGYPDLIVSGYWIKKYIINSPINIIGDRSKYYIIDIKSSSINLIGGGEYVSSGLLYDGYKAQIYIYIQALNKILKSDISIGFILGKNYQYSTGGNKIRIDDPFDKLGLIDYSYEKKNGRDFEDKIIQALKWKDDLKKNYNNYSLLPIENNLLFPNMKNPYDKNYKKIKKTIALANKEITLLWNCGLKNRELAWLKGIKNYDNENLSPDILGFTTKSSRYNILNSMLKINRESNDLIIFNPINNINEWQNSVSNEFFVDFETYSNERMYGEDIDMIDINTQIIYMIGVNYSNKFKCFILKFNYHEGIKNQIKMKKTLKCNYESYVFCDNEKDLIIQFVKFINSFNIKNDLSIYYKNTRLIHWSKAEPIIFNKKLREYKLNELMYNLPWYDLLDIFKNEKYPIIIKGCFGFGLKEIISKLNQYDFIKLSWPELDDGLLSSFKARDIYTDKVESENKVTTMIDIVEYNYIDCIALDMILKWIRDLIV